MKQITYAILAIALLLSSCVDNNNSQFYFNNALGEVINLPNGENNQYIIRELNSYSTFYPNGLPDSLKINGLQIVFSGSFKDDYLEFKYTDTSKALKKVFLPELNMQFAKRSQLDMTIHYGTSFGMCMDYCNTLMKLERGKLSFEYVGNDTIASPLISCSTTIANDSTDLLLNFIDKEELFYMNTVYGCPDCADGGSEWILVIHNNFVKKITFEYLNEPEELTPYLTILRRFAAKSECMPN